MSSFYRRRFMRILPPFICFLLLYSLLPLLWGGMTWEQSLNDLKSIMEGKVPSVNIEKTYTPPEKSSGDETTKKELDHDGGQRI